MLIAYLTHPLSFIINTLASCHLGPNSIVDQEGTPSFTEANSSSSLEQAKHHAYSFIRDFALKPFTSY
jgi:hypothetical protein